MTEHEHADQDTQTDLTITHTHHGGTLIDGTSRGDGTAPILKTCGWRWGRSMTAWYLPHSRDHIAKRWQIDKTAEQLRAAGFGLSILIDDTPRPTAEVEADKVDRQAGRVEALSVKADRRTAAADAAWSASERAAAVLPPGGEPIKVGHHSEGRHRRAIDRAHNTMGRAVEAEQDAVEAERRREAATATTGARYSAVTVGNRIQKLTADVRRHERTQLYAAARARLAGQDPDSVTERPELVQARDELSYWTAQRAQAIAAGQATDYGPHNVSAGDAVRIRGHWYRAIKANQKTVRIAGEFGPRTSPWHEVSDHRTTAQLTAATEAKQQQAGTAAATG